jgi:hypothetical protein
VKNDLHVIEVPFEVDLTLIGIFNRIIEAFYSFKIHGLALLALLPRTKLMD